MYTSRSLASSSSTVAGGIGPSSTSSHSKGRSDESVALPSTWDEAIGSPTPAPATKTSATIIAGSSGVDGMAGHGTLVPPDGASDRRGRGGSGGSDGGDGVKIDDAGLPLHPEQSRRRPSGALVPETGARSDGCDLRGIAGVSLPTPSSSTGSSTIEEQTKRVAHRIGGGGGCSSAHDPVHDTDTGEALAAKKADNVSSGSSAGDTNLSANAGQRQRPTQTRRAVIIGD